jgi:hypothetical protein
MESANLSLTSHCTDETGADAQGRQAHGDLLRSVTGISQLVFLTHHVGYNVVRRVDDAAVAAQTLNQVEPCRHVVQGRMELVI